MGRPPWSPPRRPGSGAGNRPARVAILVSMLLTAAHLPGCREIIDFNDPSPPSPRQRIIWHKTTGPAGEAVLSLRADQVGTLYAGTESGKLYRTVTGGDDWVPVFLPVQDGAVVSIIIDPIRRIFIANEEHGVYRSNDGGQNWFHSVEGMEDTAIYSLAYLPSGKIVAGSARGEVYAAGPGSESWRRIVSLARPVTYLFAVSSEDLLATTWGGGVYGIIDSSSTAAPLNAGLPDLYLNAVHTGTAAYLFAATRNSGVYRSDPTEVFWQNVGGATIGREIFIFRTSQYGELFAGTATGVYVSYDDGVQWYRLDAVIGTREVRALAIDETATVFAGTADGVYRSIRVDDALRQNGARNHSVAR